MMQRFCFTLDLKDDPRLIAEYRRHHQKIWPEITRSVKEAGIEEMEIYLFGTRIFMIMEVNEGFSFEAKRRRIWQILRCRSGRNRCGSFSKRCRTRGPGKNGYGWRGSSNWRIRAARNVIIRKAPAHGSGDQPPIWRSAALAQRSIIE
jgi:L-rhamnose mutarotase